MLLSYKKLLAVNREGSSNFIHLTSLIADALDSFLCCLNRRPAPKTKLDKVLHPLQVQLLLFQYEGAMTPKVSVNEDRQLDL